MPNGFEWHWSTPLAALLLALAIEPSSLEPSGGALPACGRTGDGGGHGGFAACLRLRGGDDSDSSWERAPWPSRREGGEVTVNPPGCEGADGVSGGAQEHDHDRKKLRGRLGSPVRVPIEPELKDDDWQAREHEHAQMVGGGAEISVPTDSDSTGGGPVLAFEQAASSSSEAEVRMHLDRAEDPGDLEIDVQEGPPRSVGNSTMSRGTGLWPACKGDVGKLISCANEKDYMALNSSYNPPGGRLEDLITPVGGWRAQQFRAVIIDVEGALVEAEPALGAVMQSVCEFFGKDFTPEAHRATLGASAHEALSILGAQVGLNRQQLDDVRGDFRDSLADVMPHVTDIPGALPLLQHLHLHSIPIAFVAGATADYIGALARGEGAKRAL